MAGGQQERGRLHLTRLERKLSYTDKHMREQQLYWYLCVRKVKKMKNLFMGLS